MKFPKTIIAAFVVADSLLMLGYGTAVFAAETEQPLMEAQAQTVNQWSQHEGTNIEITTDVGTYTLTNVENEPHKTVRETIRYRDQDSIEYDIILGPTGLSSVGGVSYFNHTPVPAEVTTKAPRIAPTVTHETVPQVTVTENSFQLGKLPKAEPATPILGEPQYMG